MKYMVWFAAQYGVEGRFVECSVDGFGVWRCGGMYMPTPKVEGVQNDAE